MTDIAFGSLWIPAEFEKRWDDLLALIDEGIYESEVHSLIDNKPLLSQASLQFRDFEFEWLRPLANEGIAFDFDYEADYEILPGTLHCRFLPSGELVWKELLDTDHSIPISELLPLVQSTTRLAQKWLKLSSLIQERAEAVVVPPWDNQVAYGKKYRARQLITQE